MPPGLPQVQLVIWSMVFMAAPAMFMPVTGPAKYKQMSYLPGTLAEAISTDRLFLLTYTMIAMGFLGLVTWDGVFPDRRDARILGPLPISMRTLMFARLGAVCYMFGLFFCVTQLPTAMMFGLIAGAFDSPGGVVRGIAGQVIATGLASAFIFFSLIAMQCALLNVLGRAGVQRVAVVLQTLFAASLVMMVLFLPQLGRDIGDGSLGPDWMSSPLVRVLPSVWFLAVYEALTGFGGRGIYSMAIPAVTVTAGVVSAAIGLYAASYARLTRRALETPPGAGVGARTLWPRSIRGRAPAWLRPSPIKRAVYAFTLRSLARSRQHRLLLSLYVALALAFVLSGILPLILRGDPAALARPGVAVTSAPLVVMFFVLVGLRTLFAIPINRKPTGFPPSRAGEPAGGRRRGAACADGRVRAAGHARRGAVGRHPVGRPSVLPSPLLRADGNLPDGAAPDWLLQGAVHLRLFPRQGALADPVAVTWSGSQPTPTRRPRSNGRAAEEPQGIHELLPDRRVPDCGAVAVACALADARAQAVVRGIGSRRHLRRVQPQRRARRQLAERLDARPLTLLSASA